MMQYCGYYSCKQQSMSYDMLDVSAADAISSLQVYW